MAIKSVTTHYFEAGEWGNLEIPSMFEEGSEIIEVVGFRLFMGVLVRDEYPANPMEESDEGILCTFSGIPRHLRPGVEDFKRIIRSNPGRVFFVHARDRYDGYFIDEGALDIHDTKGEDCRAAGIEDVDGYYIVPEDATHPEKYAKAVMKDYSLWCTGEVYGIAIWQWEFDLLKWEFVEASGECWGFYGMKNATSELQNEFNHTIKRFKEC